MATQIPRFGQWDAEDNAPYTLVFDNVRKGKNEKQMINRNDPQEKAYAFPGRTHPVQVASKAHDHDPKKFRDSSAHREVKPQKPGNDSYLMQQDRQNSTDAHKKTNRTNVGNESPIHSNFQRKPVINAGSESPSWEKKNASERERSIPPRTPGRSRFDAPVRGDEMSDKVSAIPKFGDWDINNSLAGGGYTIVFDQVREGRANPGKGNVPSVPPTPTSHHQQPGGQNHSSKSMKSQVVSWFRKTKIKLFG